MGSVYEHTYLVNEKGTLTLMIFSISLLEGSGPTKKEREKEERSWERKYFEDWQLFYTNGKHLITGYNNESTSVNIITITS